jgi:AcrR family transcriptional regulator
MVAGGGQERRGEAAQRGCLEDAMLEACGERGFGAASVQDALDRSGVSRTRFYGLYANKAECFEAAYEVAATELVEELLAAGRRAPDWASGLRTALERLSAFLAARPRRAKALLIEVHVAGGGSLACRHQLAARLAGAIDSARLDPRAAGSPPPLTAAFLVAAVDAAAARALARGEGAGLGAAGPELARMIVAAYFGEEAAAGALEPGSSGRATRAASSAPR